MRSRGFLSQHAAGAPDAGLERTRWTSSLERLARRCAGRQTTVSILPARPADAHEACRLPLRAIGYHARRDVLEVAVGADSARQPALRYFIAAPRRLALREDSRAVTLEVEDVDGVSTRVRIVRAASAAAPLFHAAPSAPRSSAASRLL